MEAGRGFLDTGARRSGATRRPHRRVRYSWRPPAGTEGALAKRGQVYDRFADVYDRNMRPLERWGLARLRARALAEVGPALAEGEGGGRLLEVGAGTGGNFPFYPKGARAACVEPSREMIVRAYEKPERPAGSLLVRGFAERLPFSAGTFDAALATLVFCSVESPPR